MKYLLFTFLISAMTLIMGNIETETYYRSLDHPEPLPTDIADIPFDAPIPVYDYQAAATFGFLALHAPNAQHGACTTCHDVESSGFSLKPFPIGKRREFDKYIAKYLPDVKIDVQKNGTPDFTNLAWNWNSLTHGGLGINGLNKNINPDSLIKFNPNNAKGWKGVYTQVFAAFDAHSQASLVPELRSIPYFNDLAYKAFKLKYVTDESVAVAIGITEQMFVTTEAPYQKALRGEIKFTDLKSPQGMELFLQPTCRNCHDGINFAGVTKRAHKVGLSETKGLFEITKQPADMNMITIPDVYNLKHASGLGHNESQKTLYSWLKYDHSAQSFPTVEYSNSDYRELTKFLKHDLFDATLGQRVIKDCWLDE